MARVRGIKQPHPLGSVASRAGVSQLTAASGATTSAHGGVKISALPVASIANDVDQIEVNQAGTSRRVTVDQVGMVVAAASGAIVPRRFGAVGNGVTDDTVALQAAIDYAAANRVAVDMSGSWTYRVSQITVPDGVVMEGSASTIAITDTLTSPSAVAIAVGIGCTIETLIVTSPGPGAGATDVIRIGNGTRIDLLSLSATLQRTGGGITTKGQDVRINYLKVVNFDRPFHAYNGPPGPPPTTGLHIGYADITSYVRGLKFTNTYGWSLGGYHLRGRSPNALQTPGHNGILIGGCSNWVTGKGTIENSGEHAFRISGNSEAGTASTTDNVRVGHLTAIRTGGCAFKIAPSGVADDLVTHVTVEGVTGIDCGETNGPSGNNIECCRISNSRYIVFEGPITASTRDFGNSCSHVLMLSNLQHFSAPLIYAENSPTGSLVLFTETGDDSPNNIENVTIGSLVGLPLLDAIRSNIVTFNVGNVFIQNVVLLGQADGREAVNIDTPLAVSGPIHVSGAVLGASPPRITMPDDPLVTRDLTWAGKRVRGRATSGTFHSPDEWVAAPFTNETTNTYSGGPFINSAGYSTAGLGNYGAGLFGSRLGSSRRGWGIWPVQTTDSVLKIGVIIGVGDAGTTVNESLLPGLTIGHRGSLTSPALTEDVVAPGAGFAKLVWVPGTTAGTAKLLAYAGTSTTPVTIVDNVGSGV